MARRRRQSRSRGVDGPAVAPSAHASAATAGATRSTGTPISRRTLRSAGIRQERRHRPPQSSPTTRMSSPPPLSTQDRTRLRASGCFPIELVPPPPANVGRGAAKLLDLVRPLSDCIEKRLVGWFAIARTGRTRYVAHRVWPAVDSRGTWGRSAVLISACTGSERGTDSDGGYSSSRGQNSQFLNFEFKVCWRGVRACDRRN